LLVIPFLLDNDTIGNNLPQVGNLREVRGTWTNNSLRISRNEEYSLLIQQTASPPGTEEYLLRSEVISAFRKLGEQARSLLVTLSVELAFPRRSVGTR